MTSNKHKFKEIQEIMRRYGIELDWKEMKYEEVQGEGTAKISLDSATKVSRMINEPFFLEDTGLYINHLSGFPGPYSSYVQKTIGNNGILRLMTDTDRSAEFLTVITYWDGSMYHQFTGINRGSISVEARGNEGFGYDPIFVPEGTRKTLAEMSLQEKNMISHRYRAVMEFVKFLSRS